MNLCDFLFDLSFFLLKFPLVSIRVHFPVTEEKKNSIFSSYSRKARNRKSKFVGFWKSCLC